MGLAGWLAPTGGLCPGPRALHRALEASKRAGGGTIRAPSEAGRWPSTRNPAAPACNMCCCPLPSSAAGDSLCACVQAGGSGHRGGVRGQQQGRPRRHQGCVPAAPCCRTLLALLSAAAPRPTPRPRLLQLPLCCSPFASHSLPLTSPARLHHSLPASQPPSLPVISLPPDLPTSGDSEEDKQEVELANHLLEAAAKVAAAAPAAVHAGRGGAAPGAAAAGETAGGEGGAGPSGQGGAGGEGGTMLYRLSLGRLPAVLPTQRLASGFCTASVPLPSRQLPPGATPLRCRGVYGGGVPPDHVAVPRPHLDRGGHQPQVGEVEGWA